MTASDLSTEALRIAQKILALHGRNTGAKPPAVRSVWWNPSVDMRVFNNGSIHVTVDDREALTVSARIPGRPEMLTVLSWSITGGLTWREELVEVLPELQRVILLDLMAEAAQ